MQFQEYIRKYIPGLRILKIRTEKYGVGDILKRKSLQRVDNIRSFLGMSYQVEDFKADIVTGTILGNRTGKAGINILGIVKIGASKSKDINVTYSIKDIRGRNFKNLTEWPIKERLAKLRKNDRKKWKSIDDNIVVMEAFYANSFTVKFQNAGSAAGDVDIKKNVEISAEVNVSWKNKEELVISSNSKVPFGIRGFRV